MSFSNRMTPLALALATIWCGAILLYPAADGQQSLPSFILMYAVILTVNILMVVGFGTSLLGIFAFIHRCCTRPNAGKSIQDGLGALLHRPSMTVEEWREFYRWRDAAVVAVWSLALLAVLPGNVVFLRMNSPMANTTWEDGTYWQTFAISMAAFFWVPLVAYGMELRDRHIRRTIPRSAP